MTANDIQIFVLTYNRPEFLERQILSLIRQTASPGNITVLDDGPNPETRRVVEKFGSHGIAYVHTDCSNLGDNFDEARKRADRDYVAVFHDDDQTHPQYMEIASKVLAAHPDVSLLGCNSFDNPPDVEADFEKDVDARGWIFSQREFASFFFNGNFGHFPFFIYKTKVLKRLDARHYLDYGGDYGKHGDSALVPLAVGDGKAAMLTARLANYGIHPGQAVSDAKSLPDAKCWARVEAVFHGLMGDDIGTFPGFSFAFRNYKRLRAGYKRRGRHDYPFSEYMRFAAETGAVAKHMGLFRFACNHYTEKGLLGWYARSLRKKESPLV